jgi:hypothetical protein
MIASQARRIRVVPYTSSVTKRRSGSESFDRDKSAGKTKLAYAPSWSMRIKAASATERDDSVT